MKCEFNLLIHDEVIIKTAIKMGFFIILYNNQSRQGRRRMSFAYLLTLPQDHIPIFIIRISIK
jgi:hypothetical protein